MTLVTVMAAGGVGEEALISTTEIAVLVMTSGDWVTITVAMEGGEETTTVLVTSGLPLEPLEPLPEDPEPDPEPDPGPEPESDPESDPAPDDPLVGEPLDPPLLLPPSMGTTEYVARGAICSARGGSTSASGSEAEKV